LSCQAIREIVFGKILCLSNFRHCSVFCYISIKIRSYAKAKWIVFIFSIQSLFQKMSQLVLLSITNEPFLLCTYFKSCILHLVRFKESSFSPVIVLCVLKHCFVKVFDQWVFAFVECIYNNLFCFEFLFFCQELVFSK